MRPELLSTELEYIDQGIGETLCVYRGLNVAASRSVLTVFFNVLYLVSIQIRDH